MSFTYFKKYGKKYFGKKFFGKQVDDADAVSTKKPYVGIDYGGDPGFIMVREVNVVDRGGSYPVLEPGEWKKLSGDVTVGKLECVHITSEADVEKMIRARHEFGFKLSHIPIPTNISNI